MDGEFDQNLFGVQHGVYVIPPGFPQYEKNHHINSTRAALIFVASPVYSIDHLRNIPSQTPPKGMINRYMHINANLWSVITFVAASQELHRTHSSQQRPKDLFVPNHSFRVWLRFLWKDLFASSLSAFLPVESPRVNQPCLNETQVRARTCASKCTAAQLAAEQVLSVGGT